MSFKKKMMAVVVVSALTAATAVPAMAFENEFHGLYRFKGIMSNFENATGSQAQGPETATNVPIGPATNLGKDQNAHTNTYLDQRVRLMYIAKANDDLKLVTHFELDYKVFGDQAYGVNRNTGAGLGADQVNLETKNLYLDFKIPSTPIQMKIGTQGFTDAYQGIILANDAPGILATGTVTGVDFRAGMFRFDDVKASGLGSGTRDLYVLEGKLGVTKDLKVGVNYYQLMDDRNTVGWKARLHTVGLTATANLPVVALDGFVAVQTGDTPYVNVDASLAAGVLAKAKVGGAANVKASFLYLSGDDGKKTGESDAWQTTQIRSGAVAGAGTPENAFYAADMQILLRNVQGTTTDRAILPNLTNLIGGFVGFDTKLSDKLSAKANLGCIALNHNTAAMNLKGKYVGTEFNGDVSYKMYDNLTASLVAAYVALGDGAKSNTVGAVNADPNNPYTTKIVLNYTF